MKSGIIVLGAPNDENGRLSSIALERCRLALRIFEQSPQAVILPTGGFGEHFNTAPQPHAAYTRAFFLEQGVPPEHILKGAHSRFTREDAELTKPTVERYGIEDVTVVTSDFHLERVRIIFDRMYDGYVLHYQASETKLPRAQLDALIAHEKEARLRLESFY